MPSCDPRSIWTAFADLPARQRAAIEARMERARSYENVGSRLGIRRQAAQQLVRKAIARLVKAGMPVEVAERLAA
jgi:DNA-directed RNA polymerase specialized sigma24 family protein